MARASQIQSQGRRFFLRHGVLGDAPMAYTKQKVSMGGVYIFSAFVNTDEIWTEGHE